MFCSYFSDVVVGNETFIYLIVSVLDPIYVIYEYLYNNYTNT